MVKIGPIEAPNLEPPTKLEYLEFIDQTHSDNHSEWSQSKVHEFLSKRIFEEYFNGDWRKGHEFHKIVITHRLYQISSTATQA